MESYFSNGMKSGTQFEFEEKGILIFTTEYEEGEKNGIQKEFDKNGGIIRTKEFKNGKLHGTENVFQDSIKIYDFPLKIFEYKDGKLDGKAEQLFPNGHTKLTSNYRNGALHGKLIEFDSKGDIIKEEMYMHGYNVDDD
jgi:uncharacterized protein